MRKLICFLLAGLLALSMTGCTNGSTDSEVPFYYPRAEFDHGTPDGVMATEIREVSGHDQELRYLMALYLQGPTDPELRIPFPDGTVLVELLQEDGTVTVTLSSGITRLEDIDLTVACACLAETCFANSDAQQVNIQSLVSTNGLSVDVTFTRGNLLLPGYEILPEVTE